MFNYKKALERNIRKHIKEEHKHVKHAMQQEYEYKCKPFEWSIPYKSRLKIFKLKRRSEVTFNPNTIEAYSYGHWCFVKIIKDKVVFNNYTYSNTTTRHQWSVRSLLKELNIKIDIEVNQRQSLNSGIDGAIHTLHVCIAENEAIIARKKSRATTKVACKQIIKECQFEIKQLNLMGARIDSKEIENIKKSVNNSEIYRLNKLKQKREQYYIDHKREIEDNKFRRMINQVS